MVDAVAEAMGRAAAARTNRARRLAGVVAMVAAAAVLSLGIAFWRAHAPGGRVAARLQAFFEASRAHLRGGELGSASAPMALSSAAHIETKPASSTRLQLLSGVEMSVGPDTRLALPDTTAPSPDREELALELGFVQVHVPKLPRGHFFAIRTPNTLVSVHGTVFSVEVTRSGPSALTRTRVIVREGVVTVQQGDREIPLTAGTEWASSADNFADAMSSSKSLRSPKGSSASVPPSQRPEREAAGGRALSDSAGSREAAAGQNALANQNRLFSDAMTARDSGDRQGAVRLLDEFVRRYPGAPLTQDAHVEQFRVLAQSADHAAAARAAREYLILYPSGFAREEARALALEARSDR